MKKRIITIISIVLCVAFVSSLIVIGIIADDVNTSIPNYFLNFTNNNIEYDLGVANQLNITYADGYATMTAKGLDPHVYLPTPGGKVTDNRYMLIVYRTTFSGGGEFYASKNDGVSMGESSSTHMTWSSWNCTGDWQTKIIDISALCSGGDKFTAFRIDPFFNNPTGTTIDIKCIAGFATEQEAKRFNLDEYLNYLSVNGDWEQPKYVEMETTPEDTYEGTLNYVDNGDGTVTISYVYNGLPLSYTVPNDPIYTSGGYAGTDDLGRSLETSNTVGIYGSNGEHYVGLFYFLWMGMHNDPGVYDLTKIQHLYGANATNANYVDPATGKPIYAGIGQFHWMAEPLYGYYYSTDEWVMRKHVELLTNAGVDFLYIDVTNAYTYSENAKKLMSILHEYNELGYNAPKVVFYTHTNSGATITQLYREIYRRNYYPDTWLYVDGKPCVVGNYNDVTNEEVKNFFTFKVDQWPNDATMHTNAWPWMDFAWPQRVFLDSEGNRSAISVSVAQHCGSVAFSDSAYYYNYATENNRGRSYHDDMPMWLYRSEYDDDNSLTLYGYNFQDQWDYAIEQDVPYVLVTGWNEWVAQRQDGQAHRGNANLVMFIDTASMEFSRDIEMMRGGYFDNYYMQLVYNIQRLKGTAPIIIQDARNPINVTGGFDQWNNVQIVYRDPANDMVNRNNAGFGGNVYRDSSGRNDIIASKVTNDTKNAYFYVQTAETVRKYDGGSAWMQLFIDVDKNVNTGWHGYDYIVNYATKSDLVTTVAKYTGNGTNCQFTVIGEVNYRVTGNEMMIAVPLEMLGITNYNEICMEFKWFDADSGIIVDEIEDFYTYGDAAPLGRLNYVYQNCMEEDIGKNPSGGPVEEETTDTPSTQPPATEPPKTEPPTTEPPTTESPTTEPATTKPSETEPPTTEPSETEPPTTDPSTEDVTNQPSTEPPTDPPGGEPPTDSPPSGSVTEPQIEDPTTEAVATAPRDESEPPPNDESPEGDTTVANSGEAAPTSGCMSSITGISAIITIICLGYPIFKRKKK